MPIILIFALLLFACRKPFPGTSSNKPRIALTLDDLPYQTKRGGKAIETDPAIWNHINQTILNTLASASAPATIFVNCGNLAAEDTLVAQWKKAGHSIGNHTAHHRSAAHGVLKEWIADVKACDKLWSSTFSQTRWFRFPYLWRGETVKRRDEVRKALDSAGYTTAPVTVDSHDWMFEFFRRKSLKQSKSDAWRKALGKHYVDNVADAIREARHIAKDKLGREVPHILLLHVNHTTATYLPHILANLQKEGIAVVPLHEVMDDPLYSQPDVWAGKGARWWLARTSPTKREDGSPWYSDREGRLQKELKERLTTD